MRVNSNYVPFVYQCAYLNKLPDAPLSASKVAAACRYAPEIFVKLLTFAAVIWESMAQLKFYILSTGLN